MSTDASRDGAHGGTGHDGYAQLVKMANDIGDYFRAEPKREDAIAGIANHIAKYWTRRMREKIAAHMEREGAGLDELPREALRRLIAQQAEAPRQPAH